MNDKPNPPLLKASELPMPLDKWDIRRENENGDQVRDRIETELRCTIRTHGSPRLVWPNSVDTPYRDHAHACWDSHVLKIPAYATAGEHAMFLEPIEPMNLPPYAGQDVAL